MKTADSPTSAVVHPPRARGAFPIDLDGVRARAQCGRLVTVVTISGEIDVSNVEDVTAYAFRSVLVGNALLLDMSGVEFFGVRGISLFVALEHACRGTGLPWALITSPAVERVLRLSGQKDAMPVANSARTAMQYFAYVAHATARPRRARGLLPMPAQLTGA